MPNWVINHLTIHGENAVETLRSLLKEKENENDKRYAYDFDFNKIIPMPESLNIISGSITETCAKLYINAMPEDSDAYVKYASLYAKAFGRDFILSETEQQQSMQNALEYKTFPDDKILLANQSEVYDYGKRVLDNYVEYGAKDWYDWRNQNWNTKWNAGSTQIPDPSKPEVYFDTAWSPVHDLMLKLSEQHPDCVVEYEYAEEQPGNFAGRCVYEAGMFIEEENYVTDSKECYEMYFKLWGGEDQFKFNAKTGTYEYIENEEEM